MAPESCTGIVSLSDVVGNGSIGGDPVVTPDFRPSVGPPSQSRNKTKQTKTALVRPSLSPIMVC